MTRMHRVFTDQPLETGQSLSLIDERAHYLLRVLRAGVGQAVAVFNGDGADYAARVVRLDRAAVTLQLGDVLAARAESPLHITLVQAVSKGERMDTSLQKATELGASAFQPVFTARTEVRLQQGKLERRMDHWHKVIISACEQSGRARIPDLRMPADLTTWAQQSSGAGRIVLVPGRASLTQVPVGQAIELVVGPEGGLDDREVEFLEMKGTTAASLGPRILRTETAGPAAIAILQSLAGDFR